MDKKNLQASIQIAGRLLIKPGMMMSYFPIARPSSQPKW